MGKIKKYVFLAILIGAFWLLYGETFDESGIEGVYEDVRSDIQSIVEHPITTGLFNIVSEGFQSLIGESPQHDVQDNQPIQVIPNKPELNTPSNQTFSVHNVEIGDKRANVEQHVGTPKRSTLNEYGTEWVTYHENYQNFFMVAYDEEDIVVGLYTNQDLITSTNGIDMQSSRDSVLSELGEPLTGILKGLVNYQLQDNGEYHMFLIDNNYVTLFYDIHENNTVTAIQIISKDLEKQKEGFFAPPSQTLAEGLEYQLFDLTNAARVHHSLPILTWDESVRGTARAHSSDMAENNYFSHTNLDGQSPFDRMEEADIAFRTAGENLAAGQTSSIFAHEGLMNSLGHRENILNKDFQALAVGVAFSDDSQPYFTENFLAK